MTSAARKLLEDALALPPEDRVDLIRSLSDSLDENGASLAADWTAEIGSRIAEIERGEVEPVAWREVDDRIRKILK